MSDEEQRLWVETVTQYRLDLFQASDRAAVDLGIAGLNAITLLNGGAIVALLAFVGQVWDGGQGATIVKTIAQAGMPFGWGVVAASVSFFAAYFYQSSVTWVAHNALEAHLDPSSTQVEVERHASIMRDVFKVLMVTLSIASVGLFLWGVVRVSDAFLDFTATQVAGAKLNVQEGVSNQVVDKLVQRSSLTSPSPAGAAPPKP